jgi:hypothetical protein
MSLAPRSSLADRCFVIATTSASDSRRPIASSASGSTAEKSSSTRRYYLNANLLGSLANRTAH